MTDTVPDSAWRPPPVRARTNADRHGHVTATVGGLAGGGVGMINGGIVGWVMGLTFFPPQTVTPDNWGAFLAVLGGIALGGLFGVALGTGAALAIRRHPWPVSTALLVVPIAVVLIILPVIGIPAALLGAPALARLVRLRFGGDPAGPSRAQ